MDILSKRCEFEVFSNSTVVFIFPIPGPKDCPPCLISELCGLTSYCRVELAALSCVSSTCSMFEGR